MSLLPIGESREQILEYGPWPPEPSCVQAIGRRRSYASPRHATPATTTVRERRSVTRKEEYSAAHRAVARTSPGGKISPGPDITDRDRRDLVIVPGWRVVVVCRRLVPEVKGRKGGVNHARIDGHRRDIELRAAVPGR